MNRTLKKFYPVTLTLLRIATGVMFWQHGAQKLFGLLGADGPVEFLALLWFAGVLECFGGILIGLGLFTRPVALILAGEMACAYFIAHFPREFWWPIQNQGERAVLFCAIYLFLVTAGPGRLSLDGLRARKSVGGEALSSQK